MRPEPRLVAMGVTHGSMGGSGAGGNRGRGNKGRGGMLVPIQQQQQFVMTPQGGRGGRGGRRRGGRGGYF